MVASTEQIAVLHVDDDPDFAALAAKFLERESEVIRVETATDVEEALERLHQNVFDCIVSDYDMPDGNGIEFLEAVRDDDPELPFILYTGKGSEAVASDAISVGVTDYLQKASGTSQYEVLANRIENAVGQYRSRQELAQFKLAVEHAGHAIYMTDTEGRITYVNPGFEEITGYSAAEAVGQTPNILNSGEHADEYFQRLWKTISNGDVWYEEIVNQRRDGGRYSALQTVAPLENSTNGIDGYVAIQQDISKF